MEVYKPVIKKFLGKDVRIVTVGYDEYIVLKDMFDVLGRLRPTDGQIHGDDRNKLKNVMKSELKNVKKEYSTPRKTVIKDEVTEIKFDLKEMIPSENVVIVITNDGYVKKVPIKSYKAATDETTLKPGDYVKNIFEVNTRNHLLLFTTLGNYLFIPAYQINECKWKDLGKHINNIVMLSENEKIIDSFIYDKDSYLVLTTKQGMIKKVIMSDYEVSRCSKPMTAIKLKNNDELVSVKLDKNDTLIVTNNNYYLMFSSEEIPVVGAKASGVKAINLTNDYVVSSNQVDETKEYLNIFTNFNTAKRVKINELNKFTRNKKGSQIIKKNKTKDYKTISAFITDSKSINVVKTDSDVIEIKNSDIKLMDTTSFGSNYTNLKVLNVSEKYEIIKGKEDKIEEPEKKEEKQEQISFDSFVDSFKI